MAEKEEKPKVTQEVMKANQGIAAQAALRAQQMMFRQKLCSVTISGENTKSAADTLKKTAPPQAEPMKKAPPLVPARGDSVLSKKPPEVPPKRHSLKKPNDGLEDPVSKQPPPLPQKPNSAQNSPLATPKLKDKTIPMRPVPPTPQMPPKFDRPPASLPQATIVSTNPFANLRNTPQLNQRSNQSSANNSPILSNVARTTSATTITSVATKNGTAMPAKKPISPIEDFSSEDALRGIESGLRNMERAMQEQMNMRSIEAALAQNDQRNFNPMEFKRNIGGSATSLDGSGNNVATASSQNISIIESMRLALNKNMRSMERGFSMEQMRLDQMHLNNSMRNFEANTGNGSPGQRPFENHMKSLDRNLPLEVQYSRHNRSHSQQETIVDQLRQNIINPVAGAAALTRDDIRLRRRSSHDENQMAQAQNGTNSGKKCLFTKMRHVSF